MANTIIILTKNDLGTSKLNNSIIEYVFDPARFAFGEKVPENKIREQFGNKEEAINDFAYYEPEIERAFFDLRKGELRRLVIKYLNIKNFKLYALVAYNPGNRKYELVFMKGDLKSIDTSIDEKI